MTMEKRNVVESKRTPEPEFSRPDENWDKDAAEMMINGNVTITEKADQPKAEKDKNSKPEDK